MRRIHDPFASPYDSEDSIGAVEELVIMPVRVETSGHEAVANAIGDIIGCGPDDVPGEYRTDSIGLKIDIKATDVISAGDKALKAATSGKERNADVAKVTDTIRSVTRSPIVGAALAATATVVPVGTVIAGIGGAAIGVAEGVMAAVDEISKLLNGPSEGQIVQAWLDKIRTEATAKAKKQLPGVSAEIKKLQKTMAEQLVKREVEAKKQELKAAEKKRASEVQTKVHAAMRRLWIMLAPIAGASDGGDPQAAKDLVALQAVLNKDMQKAMSLTRKLAQGFSVPEAKARAEREIAKLNLKNLLKAADLIFNNKKGKDWYPKLQAALRPLTGGFNWNVDLLDREAGEPYRQALAKAKKKYGGKAKKADPKKVGAAVSKGADKLVKEALEAAKKRGGVKGTLVVPGKASKGAYGQVSSGGTRGYLVLSNGRILSGRWKTA